jgi:hypothetical protein
MLSWQQTHPPIEYFSVMILLRMLMLLATPDGMLNSSPLPTNLFVI